MTGPTAKGQRSVGPEVNEEKCHDPLCARYHAAPVHLTLLITCPRSMSYGRAGVRLRIAPSGQRQRRSAAPSLSKRQTPKPALRPLMRTSTATPHLSRFPQRREFGYDAWRTASNWSVDWSWCTRRPAEQQLSDRIPEVFPFAKASTTTVRCTRSKENPWAPRRDSHTRITQQDWLGPMRFASLAATDRARARQFTDAPLEPSRSIRAEQVLRWNALT